LAFTIAGEQYAIDIENVVEIVTPRPVTRVPNADPSVVGILSLRGTIVMLIDARRRLGHPAAAASGADARIIVVEQNADHVGFFVDRVLRVVKLDAAEVEPHPVVHSSEHDDSVRGVFRQDGALTILLDLSKLLFTTPSEWN
ncbi:MAG TPA: chemotaxis protein CheW, partial [Thermoanaerobaculia bacterium]|nr:chemotaxis protein CheW [Thermoanaerobaculia bacterium]